MSNELQITIHLGGEVDDVRVAIGGHVADCRSILRGLEDGSFAERAEQRGPGTVVQVSVASGDAALEGAAARATANCFRAVMSAFVRFVDRLVAIQQLIREGGLRVTHELRGTDAVIAFVKAQIDERVARVARDTSLRGPDKVSSLAFSQESGAIISLWFELRRCIEHHGGIPAQPIALKSRRMELLAGDKLIDELPFAVQQGEAVRMRIVDRVKVFPAGEPAVLTEADIDDVAFTLHLVAAEIAHLVDQRLTAERLAQSAGLSAPAIPPVFTPLPINIRWTLTKESSTSDDEN